MDTFKDVTIEATISSNDFVIQITRSDVRGWEVISRKRMAGFCGPLNVVNHLDGVRTLKFDKVIITRIRYVG